VKLFLVTFKDTIDKNTITKQVLAESAAEAITEFYKVYAKACFITSVVEVEAFRPINKNVAVLFPSKTSETVTGQSYVAGSFTPPFKSRPIIALLDTSYLDIPEFPKPKPDPTKMYIEFSSPDPIKNQAELEKTFLVYKNYTETVIRNFLGKSLLRYREGHAL
jgi:hypothetical protein